MTEISVENWNNTFPKYPVTIEDKGWIYGVWYCGTSFTKVSLHGQYPPTFLKRALALFPSVVDVLHAPSGALSSADLPSGHKTIDLIRDQVRKPDYIADCSAMPFKDESFDLILSDPPYTKKDSEIYGCKPFPIGKFMRESHRVLKPDGIVGVLHTYYPMYKRSEYNLIGLICVVTGFWRATRMLSLFRKMTI